VNDWSPVPEVALSMRFLGLTVAHTGTPNLSGQYGYSGDVNNHPTFLANIPWDGGGTKPIQFFYNGATYQIKRYDTGAVLFDSTGTPYGVYTPHAGSGATGNPAVTVSPIAANTVQIGGQAAEATSPVNADAWSDKTGFKLAPDGLDSIATTAPAGPATTFREMMVQVWRRFFKRATKDAAAIKTYADDGTTVVTTQPIEETATTETQGAAQ
jgi:hypothetical protein